MLSEFEWDEGVVKTWTERHDDATDHKEGDAHPKKPKTKPPAGAVSPNSYISER